MAEAQLTRLYHVTFKDRGREKYRRYLKQSGSLRDHLHRWVEKRESRYFAVLVEPPVPAGMNPWDWAALKAQATWEGIELPPEMLDETLQFEIVAYSPTGKHVLLEAA